MSKVVKKKTIPQYAVKNSARVDGRDIPNRSLRF